MLAVLSLFVIPVGGAIPAGVLPAQQMGIAWVSEAFKLIILVPLAVLKVRERLAVRP